MNPFMQSTKRMLDLHGKVAQYKKVTTGAYNPETGSVTNTESSVNVKVFRKDAASMAYRFPNLIGKQIGEFLILATDLTSEPKQQDKIVFDSIEFTVEAVSIHYARGEAVLYSCVAVRG